MIGKVITCRNATLYPGMLTRGKEYTVLDIDDEKNVFKLKCDNGRTRLFPMSDFDIEGKPVPFLINWKFDDDPEETKSEDFLCWVEVTFVLSDKSRRWCKFYTPDLLYRVLNQPHVNPPGFFMNKFIAVRSLEFEDVDKVLKYLDENDELIEASLPYSSDKEEEE